jgi:hypothetical protein
MRVSFLRGSAVGYAMKIKSFLSGAAFAACALVTSGAQASVFVSAKDDIFLAGQTTVPIFPPSQTQTLVPGNGAGLLPVAVDVTGGEILNLTASGTVDCGIGCISSGPGGNPQFGTSLIEGYGNVGSYTGTPGEGFQLVGVFNAGSTPWAPFVIGTGGSFTVPTGATKLYLGLPDAFSFAGLPGTYNDNTGGFMVTGVSIPEPAAGAVMLVALAGLGVVLRSRSSRPTDRA